MTDGKQAHIKSLEDQISVLVDENAQLAQRAEDSLLLGLISEHIQNIDNIADVLNTTLEQISILKDIPYCSCGRIEGNSIQEIASYVSFSDKNNIGYPIVLKQSVLEELNFGATIVIDMQNVNCHFPNDKFKPVIATLFPFKTREIPDGIFLFLDNRSEKDRYETMILLLNHIIDIVESKYDNLYLLNALQLSNKELEQRVTDRTRELTETNQYLRESEHKFRSYIDNAPVAIFIYDEKGNYLEVNPIATELTGFSIKELLTMSVTGLAPPEGRKVASELFQHVVSYGQSSGECLFQHKSGKVRVGLFDAVKLSPKRYMVYAQDITERKLAEKEQKNLENQLNQSRKMDAVGQMAGGIAHDFNNILSIILGNASLMSQQLDTNDNAMKKLDAITKASLRASDLTKQLLSFSRKEAYQRVTCNINELIEGMNSLISRSVTPEITVKMILAEDLWLTNIDTGGFEDALFNLIINAHHAMSRGGKLTIETKNIILDNKFSKDHPDINQGDHVQLTISDTGEGISAEKQHRIFEPFYTTKPQGKGTGLGLTMVFGFVQRAEGIIRVDSELGKGTHFHIFIPKAKEDKKADPLLNELPDRLPEGNETILVVDDELPLLEITKETLQGLGYKVHTKSDSRQALEYLAEDQQIDLLFSDIVMPGELNGYDLAEKATTSNPDLKVLLTSGYNQKARSKNGNNQFDKYLLKKPYTIHELAQRLRLLLD